MRRLVRRDGVVVVQVLNYDNVPSDREIVLNRRERDGATFERSYRPKGELLEFRTTIRRGSRSEVHSVLHRPWRSDELVGALRRSGFESIERFSGIDLKPFDAAASTDLFLIANSTSS
jgi:hypothetical protein